MKDGDRQRSRRLEERVVRAAEAAIADGGVVSPIDVLVGIGWLAPQRVDEWRQGRIEYLEGDAQVDPDRLAAATEIFHDWARRQGLKPTEIARVARTPDRRPLRFAESGDPETERAYRTHWFDAHLSDRERARLAEKLGRPPDLVVVRPVKDWVCASCGGTGGLLMMESGAPVCLACAGLDHLVFLPSGDAALTRRVKRESGLSAVVVRFSRARGRYERQGLLGEAEALARAERTGQAPSRRKGG